MLNPQSTPVSRDAGQVLARFVGLAQLMLDGATPEALRCQIEPSLIALLPTLRALGLFDLMTVRDPALRRLLDDEMQRGRSRRPALRLAKT